MIMVNNDCDIRLCVPLIYEKKYLDELITINDSYSDNSCYIYETYGSLREDIIGNLRPSCNIKDINISKLKDYISVLHTNNIKFDYVINSTLCPMPIEPNVSTEDILNFINELIDIGTDSFTATNPYIILMIKSNFPSVKVNASICNEISSIHQIKEFDAIGTDCIILDRDINRKFHLIKKLRESTKKDLKVLCNSPCIYQCINVQYHANHSSFLSVKHLNNSHFELPYCSYYCSYKQFSNPVECIKSQWIRPEDLKCYNKLGINYFKLDGRDKSSEYMIEVIKAYICMKYDGNFFHLLHSGFSKEMKDINYLDFNKSIYEDWKIGIDNRELDGFIDLIQKKDIDCEGNCDECNICNVVSKKIIINNLWQKQICKDLKIKMNQKIYKQRDEANE